MIINKIKLNNIRSYLDKEITFPSGSILLSGDIGSGKSSILLSIDFALFGLRRGDLSGSSLLRNGKDSGYVELYFNIDGKDVVIKRVLKRSKTIIQDSGYIVIDGVKKEGTAIELKQAILDLLNYPKELLTKSKSLIYRYTVYTPQEEMKKILIEERELRLDILRKVFGIDKYKRVKENTKIFTSRLREKLRELNGMILDLNDRKKEVEDKKNKIKLINEIIVSINKELDHVNKKIIEKKEILLEIEKKTNLLKDLQKEFEVNKNELNNKLSYKNDIEIKLNDLNKIIDKSKNEIVDLKPVEVDIYARENELDLLNNKIRDVNNKISELNTKINISKDLKNEISNLDICPLCKQKVTEEHIHKISTEEDDKISDLNINLISCRSVLKGFENRFLNLKKEIELLRKNKQEYELMNIKKSSLEEKERNRDELYLMFKKLDDEGGILKKKDYDLSVRIKDFSSLEEAYNIEKSYLEKLQLEQRNIEIKKASKEREKLDKEQDINNLELEINKKIKIKNRLEELNSLKFWLENTFIELISSVERQVMFRVYEDFNNLFQKWCCILFDDENLNLKLDEEFTPLIEQNGYDIDYNFLSGGEKTATALAYRLALNQVINQLISDIKTKDLIILDEPTDGFSEEQLDKVKIVLDDLAIKQIIMVSHESKIESFVDNVIRLEKKNHVTDII